MKRWLFFAMILLTTLGCSDKITVKGTVKFSDGEPLTKGEVFFGNAAGTHQYYGSIKPDGSFSLGGLKDGEGIPAGKYSVWLVRVNLTEYGTDERGRGWVNETIIVDPRFEQPQTSGLSFDIDKAADIEITVERPPATRGRR
jgi:hypothetical protein